MKTILLSLLFTLIGTSSFAASDCTVRIVHAGSKALKSYATKVLVHKGYTVMNDHETGSFTLGINGMQICTDGKETFWDDLLRAYDVADIYMSDITTGTSVLHQERHFHGFAFKVMAQMEIAGRRMIRQIPTCSNGVLTPVKNLQKETEE